MGKTELTGAQITSTQAAIDQGKNRYEAKQGTSTTDLQNSARYEAKSVSVGLGAGTPAPGKSLSAGHSGVGIGSDSGSASSTSTAGISGVAGDLGARTGYKEAGLKPIFDKDKARQEVNAQVAVTSEFGKQASKLVGDLVPSLQLAPKRGARPWMRWSRLKWCRRRKLMRLLRTMWRRGWRTKFAGTMPSSTSIT